MDRRWARPTVGRTVLVAGLTTALAVGSSVFPGTAGAVRRTSRAKPTAAVLAPAPPRPSLVDGTPAEQAAVYAERFATASDDTERLAAALGAFTVADLMVFAGPASLTVSTVGQGGLPWASLWSGTVATRPGVAVPLDQMGRAFVAYFRQPLGPFLEALMADLRAGVAAGDFTALLVAADAARHGVPDLARSGVRASEVYVTAPTWLLLWTSIVQAALAQVAPVPVASAAARLVAVRRLPDGYDPYGGSSGAPPLLGEDCGTGGWGQFIGTKVVGGFKAPGAEWGGVVGKIAGEKGAARLERVTAPANAVLGILSAILQYGALTADATAKPLERTKSTSKPGKETNVEVTVRYDFKHSPDANKAFNCINAGLGALGIGAGLPSSGPVGEADVEFVEGKGFGAGGWVQWWGNNQHLTTNAAGKTFQTVAGQKQPTEVPAGANKVKRTYSVDIKVALDPDNEDSLNKFTIDGIACSGSIVAPGFGGAALGCLDMLSDIAKQINFSLGERTFDGFDWGFGYEVFSNQGYPMTAMAGKSCSSEHPERGPWTISYFKDLPAPVGNVTGPPIQLSFIGTSAPFTMVLYGPENYGWRASGTANLVGDATAGWKITFTDMQWEFWSEAGTIGFSGYENTMPTLDLQPASDCPRS